MAREGHVILTALCSELIEDAVKLETVVGSIGVSLNGGDGEGKGSVGDIVEGMVEPEVDEFHVTQLYSVV